ncbi:MAG TPA: hypothetical protein VF819_11865, partial [Nitrospira sp.]
QVTGEAAFALRSRAIYSEGGAAHQASTLLCLTQFQDPYQQERSSDLLQASLDIPFAGYNGIFSPVRPQIVFPASSQIRTSVTNPAGNDDLTSFLLIYRGVKLYPAGGAMVRTLPNARVRLRPWSYQKQVTIGATETIRQIQLNTTGDSDFILRAIQVGTQSTPRYSSLMIQLFDSQLTPYSSLPIPLDYFAGNASAAVNATFQGVQVGNWIPGLIVPEIYLLRNDYLYFDLVRNDGGGASNVLTFNFIGAKVTPA